MVQTQSKRYTFFILFLGVTLILVIYIATTSLNILSVQREQSDIVSESSVKCVSYGFALVPESLSYENQKLTFSVRNTIGDSFEKLVVKSGDLLYNVSLIDFSSGSVRKAVVDDFFADENRILLYPLGCESYAKEYVIP